MNQAQEFRRLLAQPGIVVAPGVYDGIGARAAQAAGFPAVYMTGNGAMASLLGKPDLGLATMSEMVQRAHQLTACVDIPLICDADTGYGGLGNIRRTVQEFEAAGLAGVHIEDQVMPKRCGALGGVKVVPLEESVDRIRMALKARRSPDFAVIARTDAKDAVSFEEALRRAQAYDAVGADLVMVEGLENLEQIRKVVESVRCPVLFNIYETSPRQAYPVRALEAVGVKVAINCLTATLCAASLMRDLMHSFYEEGSTAAYCRQMMPMQEYTELLGIEEELQLKDWD
ncbi:carboxyvinyl-carboxyphosphonate phosphorylmutase [Butyricicoccus sp. 1XD8-22]|nr:carboxyvinyl-carboxyphosphonate phosphorylmutase [Butyricicoccus sp. 1XD8-22]